MNDLPTTADGALPFSALRRVDEVCDQFEAALRAGLSPRPEDYLPLVAEEERSRLLLELQAIADDYARRTDERSTRQMSESSEPTPPSVASSDASASLPEKIGRYRIIAKIEEGGMGIVYKAWHPVLDQPVALKTILPEYVRSSALKDRLLEEARRVAKLRHPNVVSVYDADEEGGLPFFTMALIEGGSLAKRLAEFQLGARMLNENGRPMGLSTQGWSRRQLKARREKLLIMMEKVCRAVHAAHANDPPIIHRDLKPGNILMEGDEPRVSDFGLAMVQAALGEDTAEHDSSGTPPYMAPEQHRGATAEIGPAADVWAIGVILYELCTGRLPFSAPRKKQLKEEILSTQPPRPRELNRCIPSDLDSIIIKCLTKDARLRFPTVSELADDIGRCRRGEFTETTPPNAAQRIMHVLKHSLVAKVALPLLAALAVTAGTLSLWFGYFNSGQLQDSETENAAQALEMQRELALGHSVDLLTREGSPRFNQVNTFSKYSPPTRATLTPSAGALIIEQDRDASLITLLRDPACNSYEFTGEIRHDAAGAGGYVGICALVSERFPQYGPEYAFFGIVFADAGGMVVTTPTSRQPLLNLFLHRDVFIYHFHAELLDSTKLKANYVPFPQFRKFRIEVARGSITSHLDGQQIGESNDRGRLRTLALDRLGYLLDPDNPPLGETVPEEFREINRGFRDLLLRDAPAIYVKDSTVTLRNLKLTPTSP